MSEESVTKDYCFEVNQVLKVHSLHIMTFNYFNITFNISHPGTAGKAVDY